MLNVKYFGFPSHILSHLFWNKSCKVNCVWQGKTNGMIFIYVLPWTIEIIIWKNNLIWQNKSTINWDFAIFAQSLHYSCLQQLEMRNLKFFRPLICQLLPFLISYWLNLTNHIYLHQHDTTYLQIVLIITVMTQIFSLPSCYLRQLGFFGAKCTPFSPFLDGIAPLDLGCGSQ